MSTLPVASARETWTNAKRHFRRTRGRIVLIVALFAATAAVAVVPSWVLGRLVQDFTGGRADTLGFWIALASGFVVAQGAFTVVSRYVAGRWTEEMMRGLRDEFVDDALHVDPTDLDNAKVGDVTSRATTDVSVLTEALRFGFPMAAVSAITVAVITVALAVISPLMALSLVFGCLFMYPGSRWALKRALRVNKNEFAARAETTDKASENITGSRTVEALRLRPLREAAVDESIRQYWRWGRWSMVIRNVFFPSIDIGKNMILLAAIVLGTVGHLNGWADLGAVVTGLLLLRIVSEPLAMLVIFFQSVMQGAASFARIIGLAEVRNDGDASSVAGPEPGGIALESVSFSYNDRPVVSDVSLTVAPGEKVAVVGASGSGKTTLARLITGSLHAEVGAVLVDGLDATGLSHQQHRRIALLVNQEHHVFAATVRQNLTLGSPEASDSDLRRALKVVGAESWAESLPDGLETPLGQGGEDVDDTVAQRLALARILVSDASILILDEATALLPGHDARSVEARFASFAEDRTVITIAHRLSAARDADRVLVMDRGRIVEDGAHADLVDQGGTYARLWKAWAA
ncbi:ABC transporter ATP-binding protein [Salininema proteolyticum]|uniref:ABC transporter ATP-binding protein n=1 Tax=Salininema proteolyticum TaxID=1607685 RepID=A0ABV8U0T8_9ACTN